MNRNEVMALPNEMIRVKAAELSGWVCIGTDNPHSAAWLSHPWVNPQGTSCRDIPDYLHDIAAAWQLTDYLSQLVITKLIGRWRVEWFDGVRGREIEGESLPLAITRAFILEKE